MNKVIPQRPEDPQQLPGMESDPGIVRSWISLRRVLNLAEAGASEGLFVFLMAEIGMNDALKTFFDVDYFKSLYWICCNIVSVWCLVFWPSGMWDLSSSTRDWTHTPSIGRWHLNLWTSREVPEWCFRKIILATVHTFVWVCICEWWQVGWWKRKGQWQEPELRRLQRNIRRDASRKIILSTSVWWKEKETDWVGGGTVSPV